MTAHQITINASNEDIGYLIEALTDKLESIKATVQDDKNRHEYFGTLAEYREQMHKAQIDLLQQLIDECKTAVN